MSGPKVVRVVTRDELVALCSIQLARLDQTIEHWKEEGKRLGRLSDQDINAVASRRGAMQALLSSDRFGDLQLRVPKEIAYLEGDIEKRRLLAVEAAAEMLSRRRRVKENASTLLRALQAKPSPPAELLASLSALSRGETAGEQAEALLARGFTALMPSDTAATLSDAQREMARQLSEGQQRGSYEGWKAAQGEQVRDSRLLRVERHIAELSLVGEPATSVEFTKRLEDIESAGASSDQNLRLDSLILDLVKATEASKRNAALVNATRALEAELSLLASEEADTLVQKMSAALRAGDFAALGGLVEAGRAAISKGLKQMAARARRDAVLHGLAHLGYAVHEGMSTAWMEQGRLVVQKPGLPGYGVEVAGNTEGERLQVRAVAFSADRDAARDRDVETIWCGEFSRLQEDLAKGGHTLTIERALPIGAAPLKTVGVEIERGQRPTSRGRTS